MLTVSNAFLMTSATVIVRSGGLFWLKPVWQSIHHHYHTILFRWYLCRLLLLVVSLTYYTWHILEPSKCLLLYTM